MEEYVCKPGAQEAETGESFLQCDPVGKEKKEEGVTGDK